MIQYSISNFYKILFDIGQLTCFAETARGTALFCVDNIQENYPRYQNIQYFSINAMKERRADDNVLCFRNILLENDVLPINQQIEIVKELNVPYSTATYSGNKSIHFIISLENPLESRSQYDFVVEWIANILAPYEFDTKTKNPSRFSRAPGGTNIKHDQNGDIFHSKKQTLLSLKNRISDAALQDWLLNSINCKPCIKKYEEVVPSEFANPLLLKNWTNHLIEEGIFSGKRNSSFYEMAFDFIKAGFNVEEALSYIATEARHIGDFSISEIETSFRSAYKRYYRGKNE